MMALESGFRKQEYIEEVFKEAQNKKHSGPWQAKLRQKSEPWFVYLISFVFPSCKSRHFNSFENLQKMSWCEQHLIYAFSIHLTPMYSTLHYGSGYKLRCPFIPPLFWVKFEIPFVQKFYLASFRCPGLAKFLDLVSISSKKGQNEVKFCMKTTIVKCRWYSYPSLLICKLFLNPWHLL